MNTVCISPNVARYLGTVRDAWDHVGASDEPIPLPMTRIELARIVEWYASTFPDAVEVHAAEMRDATWTHDFEADIVRPYAAAALDASSPIAHVDAEACRRASVRIDEALAEAERAAEIRRDAALVEPFAPLTDGECLRLLAAVTYVDAPAMYESMCRHVAHRLRGKSVAQMRAILGATDDFDRESFEAARARVAWTWAGDGLDPTAQDDGGSSRTTDPSAVE